MSQEYFDDASDADFLALAGQVEKNSTSGRQTGGTASTRPIPGRSSSSVSGGTGGRQGTSNANSPTPKVVKPGFNAIVVNTRQVFLLLNSANF
jgi:hypothetical protein